MQKFFKKKIKVFFFPILSLLVIQLLFGFSLNKHEAKLNSLKVVEAIPMVPIVQNLNLLMPQQPAKVVANVYDSLNLGLKGLSHQAYDLAMKGFDYLLETGKIANDKIISIIDFSQPSNKKRLYIIDLAHYKILFNTYVAHGVNSGKEFANDFSNSPESNKSSLGFYETTEPYMGKNGYSLHLMGLEKGINDNADSRSIVIHGANYVSEDYINAQGYIGRSWGCPALPENLHKPIINKIKNGTCLFIYSPNKNYLTHSRILKKVLGDDLNS